MTDAPGRPDATWAQTARRALVAAIEGGYARPYSGSVGRYLSCRPTSGT